MPTEGGLAFWQTLLGFVERAGSNDMHHTLKASALFEALEVALFPTLDDTTLDGTPEGLRLPALPTLDESTETERFGRYLVTRELGRGGMGRILEAYDPELRRRVAVKVMHDTRQVNALRLARFVAEAQITSQLEHPSIVPVHDLGLTAHGELFYVMKRVQGRTLGEVLASLRIGDERATRQWTRHKLLNVFIRVCEAIAYAHARGILHRDLKPENIMLGEFGEVLVMDWGVARLMGDDAEVVERVDIDDTSRGRTAVGAIVGTPGFMSPEQAGGALHDLDGRSDLWSLGAILYEILTYEPAYFGRTARSVMIQLANPPEDPRERAPELHIEPEIAGICMAALAQHRSDRPRSVDALSMMIEDFLAGRLRRERARAPLKGISDVGYLTPM